MTKIWTLLQNDKMIGGTFVATTAYAIRDVGFSVTSQLFIACRNYIRDRLFVSFAFHEIQDVEALKLWFEDKTTRQGDRSALRVKKNSHKMLLNGEEVPNPLDTHDCLPAGFGTSLRFTHQGVWVWVTRCNNDPAFDVAAAGDGKEDARVSVNTHESRVGLKLVCFGGPRTTTAKNTVYALLHEAHHLKRRRDSQFATFRVQKGTRVAQHLVRWLRAQEKLAITDYEVVYANEQAASNLDAHEGHDDMFGEKKGLHKPLALPQGAKIEDGDENSVVFNPKSVTSTKLLYRDTVMFLDGNGEAEYKIVIALDTGDKTREWALEQFKALCIEGRVLAESDQADWTIYRIKRGTPVSECFDHWLSASTASQSDKSDKVAIKLQTSAISDQHKVKKGRYDPPDDSDKPKLLTASPPEFVYPPDETGTIHIDYVFEGEQVPVWVHTEAVKPVGKRSYFSDEPDLSIDDGFHVSIKSKDKEIMSSILRKGHEIMLKARSDETQTYLARQFDLLLRLRMLPRIAQALFWALTGYQTKSKE